MSYIENLEKQLFEMQDLKYRDFHSKLLPGIDRETIIGIRTPMLRKFTKEFAETLEAELFLKDLPHRYYEENNMHMMIISWIKDYEVCLKEVKKLLPYVNNWATCDLPAPKCFAKHKEELLPEIRNWISSGETYTIRYGTGMLMNFYLEEDADKDVILRDVRNALEELRTFMDIGEGTIEESQTEDKDWINNWKEFFHQFYVDDILIVPSWEEIKEEDKDKMILHIDPGTAFGTGMHETTQLVIRQLKKYVKPGIALLDVGTGSGILGITALKLGAGHVVGTDLDPCAVPAVQDNKEANQIVDDTFDMMIGNIIDDKEVQDQVGYEKYDIVAANILADVLVPLTPVIVHQMKKGAYYITSGILDVKEEVVKEAVQKAGLTLVEVTRQGEWVCVTARKD